MKPEKSPDKLIEIFVIWPLSLVLVGFIFKWYNHIFFTKQISYWFLFLLGIVVIFFSKNLKSVKFVYAITLFAACILQILSWANVIQLPIFK